MSTTLTLPSGRARRPLRRADSLVDRVHRDGNLPAVAVEVGDPSPAEAFVDLNEVPFIPIRLVVSARARHAGWSLVHEIGHLLDHFSIGTRGRFASVHAPLLEDWRRIVAESVSVRRLVDFQRTLLTPAGLVRTSQLLQYHELWARCYVQFIAGHSGDPDLIGHLHWRRLRAHKDQMPSLQWEDDDFAPVAQSIESLFRGLKWIR